MNDAIEPFIRGMEPSSGQMIIEPDEWNVRAIAGYHLGIEWRNGYE